MIARAWLRFQHFNVSGRFPLSYHFGRKLVILYVLPLIIIITKFDEVFKWRAMFEFFLLDMYMCWSYIALLADTQFETTSHCWHWKIDGY